MTIVLGLHFRKHKKNIAYWVASHCPTDNKRENYVKSMQQFINVDVYGKCGNLTCPYQKQRNPCEDDLALKYYFYLAFENSNCVDYISEKFWRNINHPVVGIIFPITQSKCSNLGN